MGKRHEDQGLVVLAVDDEVAGLNEMRFILEDSPRVSQVYTAFDSADALRILRCEAATEAPGENPGTVVDAVFADVSMPGLSGIDLGRVLAAFSKPPSLVFVTGHQENAVSAFEVGATDYIMKPVNAERFDRTLKTIEANKAKELEEAQRKRELQARTSNGYGLPNGNRPDDEVIPVELGGTVRLIPRTSVRWVEAQGDYARLHTTDMGSHLVRIPLAQLEQKWAEFGFIRVHRSFLISLPLVSELRMSSSGYSVVIGGGELKELPVSRRHTRELKDRLVRAPRQNGTSN